MGGTMSKNQELDVIEAGGIHYKMWIFRKCRCG